MLSLLTFTDDDTFFFIPALTLRTGRCETPDCAEVHGYALELAWGIWGIALVWNFTSEL